MPNVDIPERVKGPVALHLTCSTRRMGLDGAVTAIARPSAEKVVVPSDVGCCGFAGDKGFTRPEMNAHALRTLAPAIKDCSIGYSTSRLTTHSGVNYRSIACLVDSVSLAKAQRMNKLCRFPALVRISADDAKLQVVLSAKHPTRCACL